MRGSVDEALFSLNKSAKYDVYSKNVSTVCSWSDRNCWRTNKNACVVKRHWWPLSSKRLAVVLAHYCRCYLEQIPVMTLRPVFNCQRHGQQCQNSCILGVLATLVSALLVVFTMRRLLVQIDSSRWTCAVNVDVILVSVRMCSTCLTYWCCVISWWVHHYVNSATALYHLHWFIICWKHAHIHICTQFFVSSSLTTYIRISISAFVEYCACIYSGLINVI